MKRSLFLAAGMSTLLAATLMPGAVSARSPERFGRVNTHGRTVHLDALPSHQSRDRLVDVAVQLVGRPVAAYEADARQAGEAMTEAHKQSIRGVLALHQRAVASRLESLGASIQFTFTDTFNGFRIRAHANDLPAIARLPGVTAILSVPTSYRDNTNTIPYLGANKTWGQTGLTGKGVVIAILDTGINYYHLDFGGAGYAAWKHDDPTRRDGTFPTAKVIGGYDLVGDDYDADVPGSTPHPDPDPLDCKAKDAGNVQHGTHVSGTAAGFGVTADGPTSIRAGIGVTAGGHTYTGPYNTDTLKNTDFRIGPGVAPDAKLMAYRVFGCDGSSNVVADAIEMATRAGVDIISMSLSAPLGNPGSLDSVASDNASLAGITVVAAAGNEGPSAYITGSPGVSLRAISVAAMDADKGLTRGVELDYPGSVNAGGWNMYDSPLPVSGTLHVLKDGSGALRLGCSASDFSEVAANDIPVISRGDCAFSDKRGLAQAAGANAVVEVNNVPGYIIDPAADPASDMPMISVDPTQLSALVAADGESMTVKSADLPNPTFKQVADFSSAGPSRVNSGIKPDITAPGVSVFSADGGTVAQGKTLSGTSMATPAVAGVAALVKEAHPGWDARDIKAAIIGTAAQGRISGYEVRFAGSGLAQPLRAVDTRAFVYTAPGSSSLDFGYEAAGNVSGSSTSFSTSLPMTIRNTSAAAITYDLSNDPDGPSYGLLLGMPGSVTVPGHGSRTVTISATMSASAAGSLPDSAHLHGPSVGVDAFGQLFTTVTTVAGAVIATPRSPGAGIYSLRVPWQVVPRGLSRIQDIPGSRKPWTADGTLLHSAIQVRDYGLHKGVADVYAWGLSDGQEGLAGMDLRAGGVQSLDPAICDSAADPSDRCLVFALNVWGTWNNPTENVLEVDLDTNLDGKPDFAIDGVDLAAVLGIYNGVEGSVITNLHTGALVNLYLAAGGPNGSTVLLPVLASDLGLKPGHKTTFDYDAASFPYADASDSSLVVDVMGTGDITPGASQTARFDAFDPSISNGQFKTLGKNALKTIALDVDTASYIPKRGQKGWMIVSLEDANGQFQADYVPVGPLPQ